MNKSLLLFLLLMLLAGCGPQTINYGALSNSLPQLVVQAEGQVRAKPDQLQMRLGVVTEADAAGPALTQNNQRMAAVVQMLAEVGITNEEMATGQFQVRPEWSRPPRPTPANWQREIIGYQVSNELLITTTQVELAGKLLGLAQQAGANQIGGLQFGLSDPTAQRQKAIEVATEKAIRKAQTMAAAAGVKLGTLQSISLNGGGGGAQPMMLAEARMASAEPVPVAAGTVEVSAAVTLIYRIEQPAARQ
ncbi:SIMPL domain-containing protein [Malonomonas rubra]|uniref:SIMPL domain-containing protein n=1 Tax=Malonomonas rubra TaxID=57040 RepID=UPI0026EBABBA|nr:SIMPL domain-containing protein [Malonomonas rubra]